MTETELLSTKQQKADAPVQVPSDLTSNKPINHEERQSGNEGGVDETPKKHMRAAGRMIYEIILDWKKTQDEGKAQSEVKAGTTKVV